MVRKFVIGLACVLASLIVAEVGFRLLEGPLGVNRGDLRNFRSVLVRGTLPNFEPRAHTVFARPRNVSTFNSQGFNDADWPVAKTPGVPRILCLGGSTTEGGNIEGRDGQYPQLLERVLERRTGRDFEVMNAGISGWTTAEMLVSWFLTLQDYAPDVVVIHEGVNDLHARFRKNFRRDYSHWRVPLRPPPTNSLTRWLARWSDLYLYQRLSREGVPDIGTLTTTKGWQDEPLVQEMRLPAETARPFVRNVASIAESAHELGATVVLMSLPTQPDYSVSNAALWNYGVNENNHDLAALAAEQGYLFADAAGYFAEHVELVRPEFLDYVHITGKGNQIKAELVADALEREWAGLALDGAQEPR